MAMFQLLSMRFTIFNPPAYYYSLTLSKHCHSSTPSRFPSLYLTTHLLLPVLLLLLLLLLLLGAPARLYRDHDVLRHIRVLAVVASVELLLVLAVVVVVVAVL